MYSDARAALQLLVEGFKLKPERDIILYGKSIGSCPTCHLASRARVRGVVIVSGLASGSRVLFPTTKIYLMDMLCARLRRAAKKGASPRRKKMKWSCVRSRAARQTSTTLGASRGTNRRCRSCMARTMR